MDNSDLQKGQLSRIGKIVRPLLAAVPNIGGSLATIWSDWDTNRRFERVEKTLKELSVKLNKEQGFDITTLTDADMQILETVLQKVMIEHRERKRKYFANILISTWTRQHDLPYEERMKFVEAIESFDDIHIEILKYINKASSEYFIPSYSEIGEKILGNDFSEEEKDAILLPAIDKLATGYGFIRRAWNLSKKEKGAVLFSDNLSVEGIARKCEHIITEPGKRFLLSLEQ